MDFYQREIWKANQKLDWKGRGEGGGFSSWGKWGAVLGLLQLCPIFQALALSRWRRGCAAVFRMKPRAQQGFSERSLNPKPCLLWPFPLSLCWVCCAGFPPRWLKHWEELWKLHLQMEKRNGKCSLQIHLWFRVFAKNPFPPWLHERGSPLWIFIALLSCCAATTVPFAQ